MHNNVTTHKATARVDRVYIVCYAPMCVPAACAHKLHWPSAIHRYRTWFTAYARCSPVLIEVWMKHTQKIDGYFAMKKAEILWRTAAAFALADIETDSIRTNGIFNRIWPDQVVRSHCVSDSRNHSTHSGGDGTENDNRLKQIGVLTSTNFENEFVGCISKIIFYYFRHYVNDAGSKIKSVQTQTSIWNTTIGRE